jgi:hypothetical protein
LLNSILLTAIVTGTMSSAAWAGDPAWQFEEVSADIGATWQHRLMFGPIDTRDFWTGGLAAADIDNDGWVDLYIPRGDQFAGLLLRNLGNGQFSEVSQSWNIVVSNGTREASYASGAAFADIDGNGFNDLFLPGVREFGLRLYLNDGQQFTEATTPWGLNIATEDQLSLAFADVDANGFLDAAVTHWDNSQPEGGTQHLWLNQGQQFTSAGLDWGISQAFSEGDFSFTANFVDLNQDYRPDLLISSDFNTSQCYLHQGDQFQNITNEAVITDENGMGSAIGDYDNDGDMDWFVTSIFDNDVDPGWGTTGNRLYQNDGSGQLSDVTDTAGVRDGYWGWGACMADFNNDGWLDIFHVNGWNPVQSPFQSDPARLFVNQQNGQFTEQALLRQVGDTGQGRGIVCFDYDRDGDVDIAIQNNQGPGSFYRNNASESLAHHWLGVRLMAPAPNQSGIGARITLQQGQQSQVREMRIPNHFLSTSPAEVFFGLGTNNAASTIQVRWPDGELSRHQPRLHDRWVTLVHPQQDVLFADRFE